MKRIYFKIVSLLLIALLLVPQFVTAQYTTEYEVDLEYTPTGDNDEVQNRLDRDAETNRDTWDPVPQGVYVGGFSKESSQTFSMVPDTNTSICLATVTRFSAEQIMSGASYFTVRLPVSTTYANASLDIYQIDMGVNWSFEENITYPAGIHMRNNLRINFTEGLDDVSMVAFTRRINPSDESPTDGDFYFSRQNRTYVQVRAPIHPDVFYLFVTTAWYDADAYIEVYWQPESLTLGAWNRSTIATYNEIDPDTQVIALENINVSLGYSFDFVEGFGASSCGWNKYMEGTLSEMTFYRKVDEVDLSQYLTIMFPFQSSITNVSIRTVVRAFDFAGNSDIIIDDTSEWNDFILVSTTNDLDTELPAWKSHWEGWIDITLFFENETRYRFYMRDLEYTHPSGFNETWYSVGLFGHKINVHAPDYRWDPQAYFSWSQGAGGVYEDIHWQIQCSVLLNEYRWTQSGAPGDSRISEGRSWEDMDFTEKSFYVLGTFLIVMGDTATYFNPGIGYGLNAAGTALQLVARYVDLPDPFGRLRDGLNWAWDKLQGFGEWLYKVGQSIVGAIRWFVETLVYYGSIILGILVLILSMIVFWTPLYFTTKGAMAFRKAILGDIEGAMDEVKGATTTASTIAGKAGGALRRR